jgi:protein-S-isoprenylcysteine O-methyltransferase Ste14
MAAALFIVANVKDEGMKSRIKVDVAIVLLVIILSVVLFMFPSFYPKSLIIDYWLDFLGYSLILKGVVLRMAARGHKRAHSQRGAGLVTSGLYGVVRNPMYLGSFVIGSGFVLLVWPWWTLPIFGAVFYLRFNRQMVKEEAYLKEVFKENYMNYYQIVRRVWPSWKSLMTISMREAFAWSELWSTKEKRLLLALPVLAIALETMQEWVVYHVVFLAQNLAILGCSFFLIGLGFGVKYVISK